MNNGLSGFVVKPKNQEEKNDQTKQKILRFFKKFYFLGGKKKERLDAGKGGREKRTKKNVKLISDQLCLVAIVQPILSKTDENRYFSG